MERKANKRLLWVVFAALMAALVFVCSGIRFYIPTPIDKTAIHLGNIICLLSGLLFGGLSGGLSSGVGSMLYDWTNPLYIAESPITFVNKFVMGFVAGIVNSKLKLGNVWVKAAIAGVLGQLSYIVLYLGKSVIGDLMLGNAIETALIDAGTKGIVSLINGGIAVIVAVPLYVALSAALKKAGILSVSAKG